MDMLCPPTLTPRAFVDKWRPVALTERQTAQSHFTDLCRMVGHLDPVGADPSGREFCFEKGAMKSTGNPGFADVWKRGFFAWEYKKKRKNLGEALGQLSRYVWDLENPPLHVACDTGAIRIKTAFTSTPTRTFDLLLDDLLDPEKRLILEAVFKDPERLRGFRTREMVTREAADAFAALSERLGHRHPDRGAVAHFVNQLVFCFFAEDVRLLPEGLFKKQVLAQGRRHPGRITTYLDGLFAAMERPDGEFNLQDIAWFNGGLFDGRRALPLDPGEIDILLGAARLDWSEIDPTIFGTLFERFLDPDKRAQIGAHYTDARKIMAIVEPVIVRPLRREWAEAEAAIAAVMRPVLDEPGTEAGRGADQARARRLDAARGRAEPIRAAFVERLRRLSILDPACGSGNFLYLALQAVKDLEREANAAAEALGLPPRAPVVGPEILRGIEIDPLAAELARTTVWIGHIQWGVRNGIYVPPRPILEKLDTIERRDALVSTPDAPSTPSPPPLPEGEGWGEGAHVRAGSPDAAAALLGLLRTGVPPSPLSLSLQERGSARASRSAASIRSSTASGRSRTSSFVTRITMNPAVSRSRVRFAS